VGYFLSLLSALDHTRIFRLFFLSVVRIATSYRLIADGSDFESRECQEFENVFFGVKWDISFLSFLLWIIPEYLGYFF
jgi:hypothetical protein